MKILVAIGKGDILDTFIPPDVTAKLESLGTVVWNTGREHYKGDELGKMLSGVDVCITG